ncbi:hypothetical protein NE237_018319 [Protea cynaroides]|uniref:Uncharacterized protein n=1 Tax=Protea cynaroides TaxID=273540 RepID=A0A9Q0K9R4_9MAGN|nr:hypothetical protein NE237_018319 [Protea cynaroides]
MGIKLILNLCLANGIDKFPSLLWMGIHGQPLTINTLRCSREMINNRLSVIMFHDPVSKLIMPAEILDPRLISVSKLLFHVFPLKRCLCRLQPQQNLIWGRQCYDYTEHIIITVGWKLLEFL